jgi:hypothetical protein
MNDSSVHKPPAEYQVLSRDGSGELLDFLDVVRREQDGLDDASPVAVGRGAFGVVLVFNTIACKGTTSQNSWGYLLQERKLLEVLEAGKVAHVPRPAGRESRKACSINMTAIPGSSLKERDLLDGKVVDDFARALSRFVLDFENCPGISQAITRPLGVVRDAAALPGLMREFNTDQLLAPGPRRNILGALDLNRDLEGSFPVVPAHLDLAARNIMADGGHGPGQFTFLDFTNVGHAPTPAIFSKLETPSLVVKCCDVYSVDSGRKVTLRDALLYTVAHNMQSVLTGSYAPRQVALFAQTASDAANHLAMIKPAVAQVPAKIGGC